MHADFLGRKHAAKRKGAALVEFALCAPILFLFLFAGLEFGRYNMILQAANNAAFDAARACIVPGASASDGVTAGSNTLCAVGVGKNVTISINPSTISTTTGTVTATVSIPVTSNLWVPAVFCTNTAVTRSCTMTSDWVYSAR